ncbi:MAG: glycosyltransferase family A protein [Rhodothermales bacterium]
MQTAPLVSVITIFYNAERFLADAIRSVRAQTYDRWELLLVDDGSTDYGSSIARAVARCYPDRIRYLHHPAHENRGMSASRNLGLREANGEYVALLDADDVWLPGKLEAQVAIMASQPRAAMVYGRTEIWHSWTGLPEDCTRDYSFELGVAPDSLIEPPNLVYSMLENKAQTPTTCSVLFRRRAAESVGGFHEGFRGLFEDQVFFFKLCLTEPVFVSGAFWSRYRQHEESCCAVAERSGRTDSSRVEMLRWIDEYMTVQGVASAALRRALRRELRPYSYPLLTRVASRSMRYIRTFKWRLARVHAICAREQANRHSNRQPSGDAT